MARPGTAPCPTGRGRTAGAGRHHLDRAAREPERRRPHRLLARPADGTVERGQQDAATDLLLDLLGRLPELDPSTRSTGTGGPRLRVRRLEIGLGSAASSRRALRGRPTSPAHAPMYTYATNTSAMKIAISTRPNSPSCRNRTPREQEDDLDVEDDEQHRDDVEIDAESLAPWKPHGVVAAFVGRELHRVRPVRPERARDDQRRHLETRRRAAIATIGR